MIPVYTHPLPTPSPFWAWVSTALNVWHLALAVILIVGGFLLPVRYLLFLVCSNLILLFRYHDYCFVSEVTGLTNEWASGCREEFMFTESVREAWRDYLGVEFTAQSISNVGTGLYMLSSVVAIMRVAMHYNIPLVSDWSTFAISVAVLGLWVGYEVYNAFFYIPLPLCSA